MLSNELRDHEDAEAPRSIIEEPRASTPPRFISPSPILALVSVVAVTYYLVATQWNVLELLRVLVGLAALWGPGTALIYVLLRTQVPDTLARFTLSAIGSYALTTVAYFGATLLGITPLFYIAITAVALLALGFWILDFRLNRLQNPKSKIQNPKSIDWILVALISASLVVNIRYQTVYSVSPATGERTLLLQGDQTYYTGLVYELARHTPPLQQAIKAGIPERAYHMLPHLTTMLVAQFTGQGDALRAHVVYEYAFIEILMCLVFYCIVRILTRSRWGGYIGVVMLYLFALPFLPMINNYAPYLFFTLYPYVSSGLEPVVFTTPQMYSSLLIVYGILLGVLLISVRSFSNQTVSRLLVLTGLMVGAMLRFRIQIYLPLMAGFLLLACYGLWRTRQKAYLAAIAVALAVSSLLYLEMQSPIYLENTTKLSLGNNGLAFSRNQWWINFWPFAETIRGWLGSAFHDRQAFAWAWQVISLSAFTVFNVLGLPLIVATVMYLRSRPAFREWRLYSTLTVWMLLASVVGAMVITTDYDSYSVGGQMLLHTLWYLMPLLGVGMWLAFQPLKARISWSPQTWAAIGAVMVLVGFVCQQVRSPSTLEAYMRSDDPSVFSTNEWSALSYIHDSTPQQSIIVSNRHLETDRAIFSGIGGRATYYEYTGSILRNLPSRLGTQEDRPQRIRALWSVTTSSEFCRLIKPTVATHLVEYSNSPLAVRSPSCMRQVWSSAGPGEKVTVYQVLRTDEEGNGKNAAQ